MRNTNVFRSLGLLILGTLLIEAAIAQKNFLPGFMITRQGDTIEGFIDYRNWEKNPDQISFKTSVEETPVWYHALDIKQFKVGDEIYVGGIINTLISPVQTSRLLMDPVIHQQTDTTFLQVLVLGEKSLFYYKNPEGVESFYISGPLGPELLLYKRYLREQDGIEVVTENKTYTGQLALYLPHCNSVQSQISRVDYQINSLVRLFRDYYECTGAEKSFQKVPERITTEIGAIAGASLTWLNFSGYNYNYLVKGSFSPSLNACAGLYFNFVLPRNQRKWSVYNELSWVSFGIGGTYEEIINENNYSVTRSEMEFMYFKVNNMVRYSYPVRKFQGFANAGISSGFLQTYVNHKTKYTKFYTYEETKTGLALPEIKTFEFGYALGAGARYKRYSLEVRYESGSGVSNLLNLGSRTDKFYFLMGYKF